MSSASAFGQKASNQLLCKARRLSNCNMNRCLLSFPCSVFFGAYSEDKNRLQQKQDSAFSELLDNGLTRFPFRIKEVHVAANAIYYGRQIYAKMKLIRK
ncbi:hypothetical protein BaRGS_00000141 [Batillaria attramentaria]|uniref:Uncharacterized protein n=1 Tax=Batillaria attramentaria TaxID=370345 RepID=A0ABD0MB62_9CAEN